MRVKNNLIKLIKENIYHLYPKIISVDIDIKRLANRRYQSKIKLKTRKGSFFADKEDQGYRKSLEKSYRAIKKQLERVKINKIHGHSSEIMLEEHIQEDQVA